MQDPTPEIVSFIAAHQRDPMSHCANIGVDEASIAHELKEYSSSEAIVRRSTGSLVGVTVVDHDPELRRGWIHGPWITGDAWEPIAQELFDEAWERLAPLVGEVDMSYNVRNRRVADLAQRHGFEPFSRGWFMSARRGVALPDAPGVRDVRDHELSDVASLHDSCFPRTWLTGSQMTQRLNANRKLLVVGDEAAAGYAYAQADVAGEGSIEFVGVAPDHRGRGIGRRLVAASLRWLFEELGVERIELHVRADNRAALALYDSLGFERGHEVVGVRRRVSPTGT